MKHGFIKVAAATPQLRVADCEFNAKAIAEIIEYAEKRGVKILALPELCVSASTCGDLFMQDSLLDGVQEAIAFIADASKKADMLIAVGAPVRCCGKLYDCAVVLNRGNILGVVPKTHISNCGENSQLRNFTQAPEQTASVNLCGEQVAFSSKLIFCCDDVPNLTVGVEIGEDMHAICSPSAYLAAAGANVILNLSASCHTVGKGEWRRETVKSLSSRLAAAYVYADADAGESTTDFVFSGQNIIAENGCVLAENPPFGDCRCTVADVDVNRLSYERRRLNAFPETCAYEYETVSFSLKMQETKLERSIDTAPFIPKDKGGCEEILTIQTMGLAKRWSHTFAKKIVLGISGGLDSALALLVAVRAADKLMRPHTDILAVTMPCFGTTSRTKGNAEVLCEQLGVELMHVDIKAAVSRHFEDIGMSTDRRDTAYENAQARERTQVIMDIANMHGGFVLGTGDLSELALGWATYNGDHMSMYGVNADVPKTLVRHLVRYEAERLGGTVGDTLLDILDTPVSPELLPAEDGKIVQKTEDLVGPYELHDFYLYYALRWGYSPEKVYRIAKYAFAGEYSDETLLKWLKNFYKRFFTQQFKRSCLPDGPKVGSVGLSPRGDWSMPSDAHSALWLKELDNI